MIHLVFCYEKNLWFLSLHNNQQAATAKTSQAALISLRIKFDGQSMRKDQKKEADVREKKI